VISTHQVIPDRPSTHISTETLDSTVESYANNVINFLTSNLKNERVERERLASEAEAQIRRLRTQLARREAEVQALLLGKKQETESLMQIRKSTSAERTNVDLVLESQNRVLEFEIEELKHQVRLVGLLKGSLIYNFCPVTRTSRETAITLGLGDRESWQTCIPISGTIRCGS
jgi:hypothetical protein